MGGREEQRRVPQGAAGQLQGDLGEEEGQEKHFRK